MSLTITDLFCGAGGSSLGAQAAGMTVTVAANHWQRAIDVHQANFPDARHDCADISQADPRRYPCTQVLLASPECTNHSQARGVSRKRQDPSLVVPPLTAADIEALVDDCGWRMFDPAEVAAAMGFPTGYIPVDLTKKDRVKLAGNAVTPPVMEFICSRLVDAIGAAA